MTVLSYLGGVSAHLDATALRQMAQRRYTLRIWRGNRQALVPERTINHRRRTLYGHGHPSGRCADGHDHADRTLEWPFSLELECGLECGSAYESVWQSMCGLAN